MTVETPGSCRDVGCRPARDVAPVVAFAPIGSRRWPPRTAAGSGPQGVSGAKVTAVTFDGRTVEIFNEPGEQGLNKLMAAAVTKRLERGLGELRWTSGSTTVAVTMKVVSSPAANSDGHASRGFNGLRLPETVVGRAAAGTGASSPQLAGASQ